MLTPFTVEGFQGLRLDTDPFEVGSTQATAMLDLDIDIHGRLRTRPGREYVDSDDTSTFGVIDRMVNNTDFGTDHLVASDGTTLGQYDANTGIFYTQAVTGTTNGWVDLMPYANIGTLVADDTGLRVYDFAGHTLSAAAAGSPKNGYLAFAQTSSRTVIAGADTTGPSRDRVNFSDAGALTTFTSTSWVDIGRNGGERITGAVTLSNAVWVFKETQAFIFYSESVDSDGLPIFLYRTLSLGDRIRPKGSEGGSPPGRFTSDGNYIYWVAVGGVYRSAGGPPELISGAISPVFRNEVTGFTGFDNANVVTLATDTRVYVSSSSCTKTLVFEKAVGQWYAYGFGAASMATSRDTRSMYHCASTRSARLTPSVTTDLGSAITFSYTSGKYALSDPGRVAVSQESSLDGYGTVALRLDSDLYTNQNGTATLGTSPAVAEGFVTGVDTEGRWIQHTLSGTGQAQVNRLTHYVSFLKPAGVR